jgi:hypothetical protein
MTTLDRLSTIIPPDIALANKALSVSMQQITGIKNMRLPTFAAAVTATQTMVGLPLVNAQTSAVSPATANYYSGSFAGGSSVNGTYVIADFLGTAAGIPGTTALTDTLAQFATMNLTTLTTIYQRMVNAIDGDYGPVDSGPLTIPAGPAAGTYVGTLVPDPPPPDPPPPSPSYNPTALDEAMIALIAAANAEIANLVIAYPAQTAALNQAWNQMATALVNEPINQAKANLVFSELTPNSQSSLLSLIQSLPSFGEDTAVGGQAQFFENIADTSTLAGQAIIGLFRQGVTTSALNAAGIYTNNNIPSDPNPPPPQANLGPTS